MASASSEQVATEVGVVSDREALLEEKLRRSERRREAAEEWGEFLARELETRDEVLNAVIAQYEAQLKAAKTEARQARDVNGAGGDGSPSLWDRLTGWF